MEINERRAAERQPVEEAGGGEAEGFEQAERALIENAEHAEGNPEGDTGAAENIEGQRATVEYGEADEVDVTEVTSDPDAGEDDPGAGPGIAADR